MLRKETQDEKGGWPELCGLESFEGASSATLRGRWGF